MTPPAPGACHRKPGLGEGGQAVGQESPGWVRDGYGSTLAPVNIQVTLGKSQDGSSFFCRGLAAP